MPYKKSPYGRKKRKQRQKDMWRIENTRLKISQEWKSHCHMTVPQRDLAGVVAFIQCESQRIEVCTQIAEERHLPSEQNIAAEVKNKNAYQQQAKKVRCFLVKSRLIQHSQIFAACRLELEYKDKKGGGHLDSPPAQNVQPDALDAKSASGQAGPTIAPCRLGNVHVTPVQFWCVAVKRNVFAPTAAVMVTDALLLKPSGVPLVRVPDLYAEG